VNGLEASSVVVRFGGLVAVDGVSLQAPRGRITGLIGPNGAGKTTTFNVCCGYQRADAGTVTLDGHDITHMNPSHRARLGLGRTFQRMELFGSMTVRENIELAVESTNIDSDPLTQLGVRRAGRRVRRAVEERAVELIEQTGLTAVADQVAGEVSTGHGRLVELARALAKEPKMLLLDEPSSGLDGGESRLFGQLLTRLVSEQGFGILMVEHDMTLVLGVCDWVYVLDFGKPLIDGDPATIRSSSEVQAAYLGREAATASSPTA
jgi:ABC-type branched-subunit amino acid transport system ATPase component